MTSNQMLYIAAGRGDVRTVQRLIDQNLSTLDTGHALYLAALNGELQCMERLMPLSSASACGKALRGAAVQNHVHCIPILFSKATSGARRTALTAAARFGSKDALRYMLDNGATDPKGEALSEASGRNHVEALKLLLPVSKPKAQHSEALLRAANLGFEACVDVLWDVSNPLEALQKLQQIHPNSAGVALLQEKIAVAQRNVLETHVQNLLSAPRKKI